MSPNRPDRGIVHLIDPTRPDAVVADADLAALVAEGRTQLAFWHVEGQGPTPQRIAVLFGPVPAPPSVWRRVVVLAVVAIVALVASIVGAGALLNAATS